MFCVLFCIFCWENGDTKSPDDEIALDINDWTITHLFQKRFTKCLKNDDFYQNRPNTVDTRVLWYFHTVSGVLNISLFLDLFSTKLQKTSKKHKILYRSNFWPSELYTYRLTAQCCRYLGTSRKRLLTDSIHAIV